MYTYITEKRKEKKICTYLSFFRFITHLQKRFFRLHIRFLDTECEPFKQAHRCHSVLLIDMYSLHEHVFYCLYQRERLRSSVEIIDHAQRIRTVGKRAAGILAKLGTCDINQTYQQESHIAQNRKSLSAVRSN